MSHGSTLKMVLLKRLWRFKITQIVSQSIFIPIINSSKGFEPLEELIRPKANNSVKILASCIKKSLSAKTEKLLKILLLYTQLSTQFPTITVIATYKLVGVVKVGNIHIFPVPKYFFTSWEFTCTSFSFTILVASNGKISHQNHLS